MEMFAQSDVIAQLEANLPFLQGDARLPTLVALAWHLRQRDTPRALLLADEAQAMLTRCAAAGIDRIADIFSQTQLESLRARLQLVRAETQWLCAELTDATLLADAALAVYRAHNDDAACADAQWILAWISSDQGDMPRCIATLKLAATLAAQATDPVRTALFRSAIAQFTAFQDQQRAEQLWGDAFDPAMQGLHPAAVAGVSFFFAVMASLASDFGGAVKHFLKAYDAALATGQLRMGISVATNIGNSLSSLNDHQASLEWMQRGLDLARKCGWPPRISMCLTQTAETLRLLGQLEAAQELLDEALSGLAALADSRNYAIALNYRGQLALDQGQYQIAYDNYLMLDQRTAKLNQSDFQTDSLCGQAQALSHLGQPVQALQKAHDALRFGQNQQDATTQMAALLVLAKIHSRHALPMPSAISSDSAALYYLQQAYDLAADADDNGIDNDILDPLGREYARAGDYAQAYQISLLAISTRERTHHQEATNRAIAMQVRQQTERAQAESAHHRHLAASEVKRVEALQKTRATLEHLGAIGQEITAHLDISAVFEALKRHVHGLLDVNSFAIYLTSPDGNSLQRSFAIEDNLLLPVGSIALSHPIALSARCVRERREILINEDSLDGQPSLVPGTLSPLSLLFAPLTVGDRVLGVMSVQSLHANAYAEAECIIFRTLCAYGAIALDNANAYGQLQQAQTQLVEQEKLAALGALVAGVAHELNTPLGNSLIMASALQQKTDAIDVSLTEKKLQHSDLADYLCDAQEASAVIMRGLSSAAQLINSFKQVAVDRTSAQRRVFDLQQTCQEIIATMMSQIRLNGHEVALDIAPEIVMSSYPGPLGQVISNLINNALLHAFEDRCGGRMLLSAHQEAADRVQIEFRDDGVGIAEQNLKRIFDPFFTTKMGQGSNGLGLSINDNIVTSLLSGNMSVTSVLGEGSVFLLDLPLVAPVQED
jgi:signal transduction histidine kinase/tetratricopeptide (TPR) repeat protein